MYEDVLVRTLGFSNGTCGDVPFKLTGSRMGNLLRNGPLQRKVCGDVVLQVRPV